MSIALISAISCFAGQKKLSNGSLVFWPDNTDVIMYNSVRLEVRLTDVCDFNVVGTMYIEGQSGDRHSQNFIIYAGEKNAKVDFDGLRNDCRYYIKNVEIKDKTEFPRY